MPVRRPFPLSGQRRAHRPARFAAALPLAFGVGLCVPAEAAAQVRPSERAGTWQVVDGTTIRVEYSRPAARGRTLFGELVRWDQVWTPGANHATTFEVDREVRLAGHRIAAGTYSVWIVPGRHGWTFNLHPQAKRFHTQRPPADSFAVSIPVGPTSGAHVELLTFDFPEVRSNGTTLRLCWGEAVITLPIRVRATLERPRLTRDRIERYVGSYRVRMPGDEGAEEFHGELFEDDGHLRMRLPDRSVLELIATDEPPLFRAAFLRDGEVFDVEEGQVEIRTEGARAVGFTARRPDGQVWLEAARQP